MMKAGSLTSNPTLAAIQRAKAEAGAQKPQAKAAAAAVTDKLGELSIKAVPSERVDSMPAAPASPAGQQHGEDWHWWDKMDNSAANLPTRTEAPAGSFVPQTNKVTALTGASKALDFGSMFTERRDSIDAAPPAPAAPAVEAAAPATPAAAAAPAATQGAAKAAEPARAGSSALWRQLDTNVYNVEADGGLDLR